MPRFANEIEHNTTELGCVAYEQKNNRYYWRSTARASLFISSAPSTYSSQSYSSATNSSVSVANNYSWPVQLHNASLFPYLLPIHQHQTNLQFHSFVNNYYKSACAIMYYPVDGDCQFIGSGTLTDDSMVVTARHNFENVPIEKLFVRFFNFTVNQTQSYDYLLINESYLDMPVLSKSILSNNMDAGYLTLAKLIDNDIFRQYATVIPPSFIIERIYMPGKYIMMHYAGGLPQVSLGVEQPFNSEKPLHENIIIQGAPAASGAAVLFLNSTGIVSSIGVCIYRNVLYSKLDYRILLFSQFNNQVNFDPVTTPIHNNEIDVVFSETMFSKRAYPLLRWRNEPQVSLKVDHPFHVEYVVTENRDNHHIIPLADMLYLWDYLHKLDEATMKRINISIATDAFGFEKHLLRQHDSSSLQNSDGQEHNQLQQSARKNISIKVNQYKQDEKENRVSREYRSRYGKFYQLLQLLCQPGQYERTWFAWSWWNIFQGWSHDYRADTPFNDANVDFSEKSKPKNYNPRLWSCLKDNPNGLHAHIQDLKKSPKRNPNAEKKLYDCLTRLKDEWTKLSVTKQQIHPYNEDEWQCIGKRNGHDIYELILSN